MTAPLMHNPKDWKSLRFGQKARAWFVVILASFFFFYEFIQMNMFNSLSQNFEQTFSLTALQVGLVSAFYFLSDSILLYPIGIILDRYSSRKMIIWGMILCILGTLMISLASNSWLLVLARLLAGSAAAFCLLSILRLATMWFPATKMGQVSGIAITVGMLGGAVSQAPLTWLISLVGWREALRDVAGLGVALLILIIIFVKDAPPSQAFSSLALGNNQVSLWKNFKTLCRNTSNWHVGFFIATMNLPIMLLAGLFGTQFLSQGEGFTYLQGSTISMMIFVGTIVGSTLTGVLSDFLKCRRLPMIACSIASFLVFGFILFGPHPSYLTELVLFFILGLLTAAQIIGYPVAQELNPRALSGSALGFISVIIMGLPVILQPLTGYLMDWHAHGRSIYNLSDYRYGLVILMIGFVVSLVNVFFLPESYGVNKNEI
ncbi:MAG: MFS transporter [Gammaproteobacteria bacterium]|nr:MFS transporter [Gammaproteobacteria bacterium]